MNDLTQKYYDTAEAIIEIIQESSEPCWMFQALTFVASKAFTGDLISEEEFKLLNSMVRVATARGETDESYQAKMSAL
jgi:hypothetical protein